MKIALLGGGLEIRHRYSEMVDAATRRTRCVHYQRFKSTSATKTLFLFSKFCEPGNHPISHNPTDYLVLCKDLGYFYLDVWDVFE